MAALAMPILIINMGGEMVYILEQRLDAQGVSSDKAARVLADVTRTMYHESFVRELFKPQMIYSVQSVRQIFDRLAHSSIMRLNEASMDKLFDLMLMGFKYQLLSCSYPAEVLQVTLTHLRYLVGKVNDKSVADTVSGVSERVMQTYGEMCSGEWGQIRRALCGFFQDRKVKVSLFLQDGLQKDDGSLVNNVRGLLPPGIAVPGRIRTFGPGGGGAETASSSFVHPLSAELVLSPPVELREFILGQNIYARERPVAAAAAPTIPSTALDDGSRWPSPAASARPVSDSTQKAHEILAGKQVAHATKELNLLASLITAPSAPVAPFKINLFPDSLNAAGGGGEGGGIIGKVETITIDFNKAKGRQELDALVSGMGISGAGARQEDDEDDLLALMDQASGN